ncbi:MAG: TIGR03905 family TSCPD domain-containing protein [Firmicutes bacterium]|nr:TIGR03905 family TSCPD domain-containing protein [Bacillota bacterium]
MESYNTKGTCSRQIIFEVENNILKDLKFAGGCSGNLKGISRLVIGRDIQSIIADLKGIQCRNGTSCPDQLAAALTEYNFNQSKAGT